MFLPLYHPQPPLREPVNGCHTGESISFPILWPILPPIYLPYHCSEGEDVWAIASGIYEPLSEL